MLKFITDVVTTRNKRWKERIKKEDGFFKQDLATEQDLKPKIQKWRSNFEANRLKNELGKMHVYDPTMAKRDLDQNLKTLKSQKDLLGSSTGMKEVQSALILKPEQMKLRSYSQMSLDQAPIDEKVEFEYKRQMRKEQFASEVQESERRVKELKEKRKQERALVRDKKKKAREKEEAR